MKRYVVYVEMGNGDFSYNCAFDSYREAKSCFEDRLSKRSGYIDLEKNYVITRVLKRYNR